MNRETGEVIMTLGKKEITQMTVLAEKIEEEMVEEIMILAELTPLATGIHEISARRFHTWGNLQ